MMKIALTVAMAAAAFHARRLSRAFMPSTMAYRSGPPLWMTLPHTKPNSHWPRCSPAPQLRRKRPLSEFGLRVEIKKKKQRGGYARAASRQGLGFPNPNRGHASDTSDARTSGDRGDIAFPNRSAGCHNRSSPYSSDAPGTQAGRYQLRNPVPEGKLLAPGQSSRRSLQSCRGRRRRSSVCLMFS